MGFSFPKQIRSICVRHHTTADVEDAHLVADDREKNAKNTRRTAEEQLANCGRDKIILRSESASLGIISKAL